MTRDPLRTCGPEAFKPREKGPLLDVLDAAKSTVNFVWRASCLCRPQKTGLWITSNGRGTLPPSLARRCSPPQILTRVWGFFRHAIAMDAVRQSFGERALRARTEHLDTPPARPRRGRDPQAPGPQPLRHGLGPGPFPATHLQARPGAGRGPGAPRAAGSGRHG